MFSRLKLSLKWWRWFMVQPLTPRVHEIVHHKKLSDEEYLRKVKFWSDNEPTMGRPKWFPRSPSKPEA